MTTELPLCPGCGQRPVGKLTLHEWDYCHVCTGSQIPTETDAQRKARLRRGEVLSPRTQALADRYRRIYPWLT